MDNTENDQTTRPGSGIGNRLHGAGYCDCNTSPDHEGWLEAAGMDIINDHCHTCGYDLGTHHPTCGMSEPDRLAYLTNDPRESLASLMTRIDFWIHVVQARAEAQGWWQYTDEHGDTYTTNSEY